jgi:S1-C subfamily serine protease
MSEQLPQSPPPFLYPPANPYAVSMTPRPHGLRAHPRLWKGGAAATALAAVAAVSFAAGSSHAGVQVQRVPSAASGSTNNQFGQDPFGNSFYPGGTNGNSSGSGSASGSDGSGSNGSDTGTTASSAQQVGVVDITTTLGYQGAAAAGTGMVLDSSGDILTNNHVVDGATSIKVTIVSTGQSYRATVVGTDPSDDIAVVKLVNASDLTAANFGDSDTVKVGDTVTGVGNAGGVGGTPSAATGKVLALHQSITASDDGANAERLPDVIVSDAAIQAGDSGGPLFDTSNKVVGIDTAANTSGSAQGFSIPIDVARDIAGQILAGNETTSIHIGYPAFLGISVGPTQDQSGALVSGVLDGTPAASSGIVAGDRITRIGSTRTPTAAALSAAMSRLEPGATTRVTYVDRAGHSHIASVTLTRGPAD